MLLPVRLETRFFTLARRQHRAAGARLSGQDPPRLARARAHCPTERAGASTTGNRTGAPATTPPRVPRPGGSSPIASAPSARRGSRACCSRPIRPSAPDRAGAAGQAAAGRAAIPDGHGGRDGTRRLAPRAAGAAAARPLDRRRAVGRPGRIAGHRHATSSGRWRSAPIRRRRARRSGRRGDRVADRSRHEMDGRLRRGRSAGMALRITVPPAAWPRVSTACWCSASRPRLARHGRGGAAGRACSTPITTPTGSSSCRFGTPTNNTDDRRAGYNSRGSRHTAQLRHRDRRRSGDARPRSNASRVGTALGLPASASRRRWAASAGPADVTTLDMRSMNTALWQVGWGYYLTNMIGSDGPASRRDTIAWARDHFLAHVRSVGPFPLLRCGRQPYGMLPVTSLDQWQPRRRRRQALAPDVWLPGLLHQPARQRLAPASWRRRRASAAGNAARSRCRSRRRDAHRCALAALQHARRVGPPLSAAPARLHGRGSARQRLHRRPGRVAAGCCSGSASRWRPRLTRAVDADLAVDVTAPLVQAGEVSPWRNAGAELHRRAAGGSDIENVIAVRPDPTATDRHDQPAAALLRHALLREIADAAAPDRGGSAGQQSRGAAARCRAGRSRHRRARRRRPGSGSSISGCRASPATRRSAHFLEA